MKRLIASSLGVCMSVVLLGSYVFARPLAERYGPDISGGDPPGNSGESLESVSGSDLTAGPDASGGDVSGNMLVNKKLRASDGPLPVSDQLNEGNWVLDETLSDEFEGSMLDTEKWQPIPYTWAGAWRWQDDNISVSDGKLHLNARHDKNDILDESPNGWDSHNMYDGDSVNGEYVTSLYGSRSGRAALVYGNFFPIWVRTDTVIRDLDPEKTYTLSAWIKKTGSQPITKMFAVDPAEKAIPMATGKTLDINESDDYELYTIAGIRPNGAGECKIGFEVNADPYAMTIVDDVKFCEEGSASNLAPNPGFEDITDMNYSSGGIISRRTMKYGYMETRAKGAPALPGACSAIWLIGRTQTWGTEIDVLEIGQTQTVNELDFAVHTFKTPTSVQNPGQDKNPHGSSGIWGSGNTFNPGSDYHTYGLEWGPGFQNFYVDGELKGRFYSPQAGRIDSDTVWQQVQSPHSANMDAVSQNLLLSLGLRPPYRDGDVESLDTVFDVDYIRIWRSDNPDTVGNIKEVNTDSGNLVVPYGTTPEELEKKLEPQVAVMLNDASVLSDQRTVDVVWDTEGFDGTKEGTVFTVEGELVNLPEGVTNTDNIKAKLNIYIQNKPYRIDRQELKKLTERFYDEREYKSGSYKQYLLRREEAEAVLDDPAADDARIEEAYARLKEAIENLEELPDLGGLVRQEFSPGSYTTESWIVYSQAMDEAKAVLEDQEATGAAIEEAYDRLKAAIDGLAAMALGENVLLDKQPSSNTSITHNAMAATDGMADTTEGWGPNTNKNVYTTVTAGTETNDPDKGYSKWEGAYLQYDFGEEKAIQQVQINRFWYLTDLRALSFKDCLVQLSTTAEFTQDTTVTIFGPSDIAMPGDTDISGTQRKEPQVISLKEPVNARYIRVFGKGHFGGWGTYSARMSYSEIQAFEAPAADTTGLKKLLEYAGGLPVEEYPQEAVEAFNSALALAENVMKNPVSQAQVNLAAASLQKAVQIFIKQGKQELQTLYDKLVQEKEDDYTVSTWKPFALALEEAGRVLENEVPQSEVNGAGKQLEDAFKALVKRGDIKALREEASRHDSLKPADFTKESWKHYQEAWEKANAAVMDNSEITQEMADSLLDQLVKAYQKLETAPTEPTNPTEPTHPTTPAEPSNPPDSGPDETPAGEPSQPEQDQNVTSPKTGDPFAAAGAIAVLVLGSGAVIFLCRRKNSEGSE